MMIEDEENAQSTGELSPGHGMLLEGAAAGQQELVLIENIQSRIHTIRGVQVMLDSDLAEYYGVKVRRLNEQVKRNIERFPEMFCFQLTDEDMIILKSQFATASWGGRQTKPYAFTEQGVAMPAGVLRSETAVKM